MAFSVRVLGGSWVVISGDISRVIIVISPIRGLITLFITTHEPPSMGTCSAIQAPLGIRRLHPDS